MNHSAASLLRGLHDHQMRIFSTADVIAMNGMTPAAATHALQRLADQGLVSKLKRAVWANQLAEGLEPFEAVSALTAPWPGYISFYSALSHYGLVDEIPHAVYVATPGKSARWNGPLGEFRIHHLPQKLFWGFRMQSVGRTTVPMAEPEKAFLDLAYLGLVPRSPLGMPFKRDRKWKLDRSKLTAYARRFGVPALTRYLKNNLPVAA